MEFDFARLDATARYRILTSTVVPRPIAWITTVSAEGVRNAAPFSFFNAMGKDPPLVAVGILDDAGRIKDTARNILETGEFVVNLVSEAVIEAMNATSAPIAAHLDELALAGLETAASSKVRPERIARSPVALECRLHTPLQFPSGQLVVIGEVLSVHVHDGHVVASEPPRIETDSLQLVARMAGRDGYLRTRDTFALERPVSAEHSRERTEEGTATGTVPSKTR